MAEGWMAEGGTEGAEGEGSEEAGSGRAGGVRRVSSEGRGARLSAMGNGEVARGEV